MHITTSFNLCRITTAMIWLMLCSAALVSNPLQAQVYRWVDEQGNTHYGDKVPLQYRDNARPLRAPTSPTDAEREAAYSAAARTRALAEEFQRGSASDDSAASEKTSSGAEQKAKKTSKAKKTKPDTSCKGRIKAWRKSSACFSKYRNANASVKAEAFKECQDVARPDDCL